MQKQAEEVQHQIQQLQKQLITKNSEENSETTTPKQPTADISYLSPLSCLFYDIAQEVKKASLVLINAIQFASGVSFSNKNTPQLIELHATLIDSLRTLAIVGDSLLEPAALYPRSLCRLS